MPGSRVKKNEEIKQNKPNYCHLSDEYKIPYQIFDNFSHAEVCDQDKYGNYFNHDVHELRVDFKNWYNNNQSDITLMIEQMGAIKDQIHKLTNDKTRYYNDRAVLQTENLKLEQENKKLREAFKIFQCDYKEYRGGSYRSTIGDVPLTYTIMVKASTLMEAMGYCLTENEDSQNNEWSIYELDLVTDGVLGALPHTKGEEG